MCAWVGGFQGEGEVSCSLSEGGVFSHTSCSLSTDTITARKKVFPLGVLYIDSGCNNLSIEAVHVCLYASASASIHTDIFKK